MVSSLSTTFQHHFGNPHQCNKTRWGGEEEGYTTWQGRSKIVLFTGNSIIYLCHSFVKKNPKFFDSLCKKSKIIDQKFLKNPPRTIKQSLQGIGYKINI